MVYFTQMMLSKLGFERCTGDDSESNPTGLGLALNRRSSQSFMLSTSNVQPHGAPFVIVLPWQPLENQNIFDDKFISNVNQIGASIAASS